MDAPSLRPDPARHSRLLQTAEQLIRLAMRTTTSAYDIMWICQTFPLELENHVRILSERQTSELIPLYHYFGGDLYDPTLTPMELAETISDKARLKQDPRIILLGWEATINVRVNWLCALDLEKALFEGHSAGLDQLANALQALYENASELQMCRAAILIQRVSL